MPNPKTDQEWIDCFILDQLAGEEKIDFQQRLEKDTNFSDQYQEQLLIAKGIRLSLLKKQLSHFQELSILEDDTEDLEEGMIGQAMRHEQNRSVLERLKERGKILDEESLPQNKKSAFINTTFFKYISAAAVFIFLITFWWADNNYSNNSIIQELYEPLLDYQQAGETQNKSVVLNNAKVAFFNEQYEATINALRKINEQDGALYFEAQGLLAYSYFSNKDYSMAINQFDLLLSDFYNSLSIEYQDNNRLRWTRMLSYLGNDEENGQAFQRELNFFLNNKSEIYRSKAQSLQMKLDSHWRNLVLF